MIIPLCPAIPSNARRRSPILWRRSTHVTLILSDNALFAHPLDIGTSALGGRQHASKGVGPSSLLEGAKPLSDLF